MAASERYCRMKLSGRTSTAVSHCSDGLVSRGEGSYTTLVPSRTSGRAGISKSGVKMKQNKYLQKKERKRKINTIK